MAYLYIWTYPARVQSSCRAPGIATPRVLLSDGECHLYGQMNAASDPESANVAEGDHLLVATIEHDAVGGLAGVRVRSDDQRTRRLLAHRLLHVSSDPCLVSGSQRRQCRQCRRREEDRPQSVVEVRAGVEAKGRVPRLELPRGLEAVALLLREHRKAQRQLRTCDSPPIV